MWNWLEALLNLAAYPEPTRRTRVIIAHAAVWGFGLLFTLFGAFAPFEVFTFGTPEALTYFQRALRPMENPLYTFGVVAHYSVGAVTLWGLWSGRFEQVVLGAPIMVYVGAVGIGLVNNFAFSQNAFLLIPPLLLAGLLDGERGLTIFTPVHFIALMIGYQLFIGRDPANLLLNLVILVLVSAVIVALMMLYLQLTRLENTQAAQGVVGQRLRVAQLTTRIAQGASSEQPLESILMGVVDDMRETFPEAYHVQVFLLDDERRAANLIASTGEPGRQLLSLKHSLSVGGSSVIGYVTQQGRPYRTVVGEESVIHRPNPYLPDTRLEFALPLIVGARIVGALDLQSRDPNAFGPTALPTLQAIADSIAVTINAIQLRAETQQQMLENQQLVGQMRAAQGEVERLNRELTGTIWQDYLKRGATNYNMDLNFEDGGISTSEDLSESIMDAIDRDEVVHKQVDGRQVVAVPLRVRGEVIGAMEFEVEDKVSNSDLDMLREVGERFGIAAENSRLYRNSQRLAQREALVNEISTRIQSANSVDATLSEAARSLRDALKARRVAIRLGKATTQPASE